MSNQINAIAKAALQLSQHERAKLVDMLVVSLDGLHADAEQEKHKCLGRNRLAAECAKLDPAFEQAMAEEGLRGELAAWPKY
ncbi:MAG: hypothetical protein LBE21_03285 [Pseudomonadales bacterium]|jgi:hypothetical protein|nr:hypothetical protein [Pseudomonadales bacterium]